MTTNTNSKLQVSGTSFKRGATIMLLMGGLLLSACNPVDPTPTGTVESIKATAPVATVKVGGTVQLVSTVVVTGDAKKDVTYKSSDVKIATVSAGGLVTGVAVGPVTITVTSTADISKVTSVKLDVIAAVTTATPAPTAIAKINFQTAVAAVDPTFTPNSGAAFAGTSGWLSNAGTPAAQTAFARLRTTATATGSTLIGSVSSTPVQNGFITLQVADATDPTKPTPSSAFEYVLPKGKYTVTVSAGDAQFINSKHTLNLEKTPAFSSFAPTALNLFKTITTQVQVDDGKLTIDGIEGVVTKLNYVVIAAATNPSIRSVTPDDGQTGVAATPTITADFNLVNATAIDTTSLTAATVQLFAGTTAVAGTVTATATGVTFKPTAPLAPATVYTFKVMGGATGAKDTGATPAAFFDFVSTFKTQ